MNHLFKIVGVVVSLILFSINAQAVTQKINGKKPDWTDKVRYETRAVKRISAQDAFGLFKMGKALLISVDSPNYYKKMTAFAGGINIPSQRFLHSKKEIRLPGNKLIIMYCR